MPPRRATTSKAAEPATAHGKASTTEGCIATGAFRLPPPSVDLGGVLCSHAAGE
ncbi:MAG: hypothetical protein R3C56_15455 [Pirellulaceae bacterium]